MYAIRSYYVVDADNAAAGLAQMTPHHQGGCSQRTAQIIQPAAGLSMALCHHANGGENVGITRHRALDHVRENLDHLVVKTEVAQLVDVV